MPKPKLKLFLALFLPIQILIFEFIKTNPELIDKYYIEGFFKVFTSSLRYLLGGLNFSIGLFMVYILVPVLIFVIYKKVFKKPLKKALVNLASMLSILYLFYMLTWGLAYYKTPIDIQMSLNRENISNEEVIDLAKELIDSTNKYRLALNESEIKNRNFDEIAKASTDNYQKLATKYPFLDYRTPSIKQAFGSNTLAYMSTSGIYFFPSAEANVNTNNLPFDVPYVMAHEMSHQMGFASEDEANYLAYLSSVQSQDPFYQYSAYYNVGLRTLFKVWEIDSMLFKDMYKKLDTLVKLDRIKDRANWQKFKNPIQEYVIGPFYDVFLKSNGQEQGSRSYDLVVDLLIAERRKRLLVNPKIKTE